MGAWGVLAAGWLSLEATGPSTATRAAALLVLAAAIALGAAWRAPDAQAAPGLAWTGGLVAAAAAGGVLRSVLPDAWTVPGYLACGVALLAVRGTGCRSPYAVACGGPQRAVQALAVAWTLPLVAVAAVGPVGWAAHVWTGAPSDARDAVTVDAPWPASTETAPLVLAAVAAVLALAFRGRPHRSAALCGALGLAWATLLVLPATLELPYLAALLGQGVTVAAALTAAAYSRRGRLAGDSPTPLPSTPAPAAGQQSTAPHPLTALCLALLTSSPPDALPRLRSRHARRARDPDGPVRGGRRPG